VTVDPAGQFALVTNASSNSVTAFAIDPVTGALTKILPTLSESGHGAVSAAVDPSGRFVWTDPLD